MECWVEGTGRDGDYAYDCMADFELEAWWALVSQEAMLQDEQFEFFVDYWNAYHYSDCEGKALQAECSDFTFMEGEVCQIDIGYSFCMDDLHISCLIQGFDDEGNMVSDNCAMDFYDPMFWYMLDMEEQFWEANPEYADFRAYFQTYHEYDDEECPQFMETIPCGVFTTLPGMPEGECNFVIAFNPCFPESFTCEAVYLDYNMEVVQDECVTDFMDPMFWSMISADPFWDLPQAADFQPFYQFWEEFHAEDDDDTGDDCVDMLYEKNLSCLDFEFLSEMQCNIDFAYNPCAPEMFMCDITVFDPSINDEYVDDCTSDFYDKDFFNNMTQEMFWQHPDNAEFLPFMEYMMQWHMENPDGDDDDECKDFFRELSCQDFSFSEED
jgi:hypothetical protein